MTIDLGCAILERSNRPNCFIVKSTINGAVKVFLEVAIAVLPRPINIPPTDATSPVMDHCDVSSIESSVTVSI